MNYLQNEEKLLASNGDKVVLTNQRVMMEDRQWGKSYKISMFLENISSIEILYKSNPWLLIIGIALAIGGLVFSGETESNIEIAGLFVGGIFVFLWWFSRKHTVSISSNGGSALNFIAEGMSGAKIDEFVTHVQEAKAKRVGELFHSAPSL